jgi:hypothetical protein
VSSDALNIFPLTYLCPSSPGPGGTRKPYAFDHRAASNSSIHDRHASNTSLGYRFQSGSNASIDRQLARDFQTRANLDVLSGTTPGSSSTGGFLPSASSVSGPTTPYGHTMGHAVSGGVGVGRPHGSAKTSSMPYFFRDSDSTMPDPHLVYTVGLTMSRVKAITNHFLNFSRRAEIMMASRRSLCRPSAKSLPSPEAVQSNRINRFTSVSSWDPHHFPYIGKHISGHSSHSLHRIAPVSVT